VPEQGVVLLLALALFTLYPHPSLWALAAAYAIAWLVVNALKAARPSVLRLVLPRSQAIAIAACIVVPWSAQVARLSDRLIEDEDLDAVDHLTGARLRLEATPAIAPPLVAADRPQTFYVHAPGAREVAVRFGPSATPIRARGLGHGVFRLEYDPREHGPPEAGEGDGVRATIVVDTEAHERAMLAVAPLAHPRWLAPSPDRSRAAAVSEETDELVILDRRGLVHRVPVDDGPTDARFLSERELVVAHRYARTLAFVDVESGRITRRREVGPLVERVAIDGAQSRIALAHIGSAPRVAFFDAEGEAETEIALGYQPDHLAFGAGADTLVVSSVRPPALHRFHRDGERWREDRPPLWLGRPAVTMTASADRASVIVAVTDVQADGPPHLGNHFIDDQLVTVDLASWSIVRRVRTARRTNRQDRTGNLDRGVSPMGIDALEDGSLLVAFAGTDDVWRIEERGEPTLHGLDEQPLAAPCSAVALSLDGRSDGFAVSSPSYGAIGIFDRAGRRTALVRLAPDDRALLSGDERALQRRIGERTFYESTRAGVSCQSCHLHGGSDGTKHNIGGLTLVGTLDTRGLLGTPPYLRDGGYPLLGSLDELAQTLFRGYLRHQGGRRLSLDRYLEALPRPIPPRQLEGSDEARERRGLDVFMRARCALCHAPPAFTNLGQHPTESLFPDLRGHGGYELDTPSLLGLGQSAPYLVDGRAETLVEVFREHDRAGRHGDTSDLTDGELADLVYFLEGL
jgi:hypothetical protein